MSITYKGVRNGGLTVESGGNISTSRTLVYHFNAGESALDIFGQTQVPRMGEAHPTDATFKVVGIQISEPQQGDSIKSGEYSVTINYSRSFAIGGTSRDQTVEPWNDRPYNVAIYASEVSRAFIKAYQSGDTFGSPSQAVLNTAGDPYEENIIEQNTILAFSYNLRDFDLDWIDNYTDTINLTDQTVCDKALTALNWRIRTLNANKQIVYDADGEEEYSYWKVDVELEGSSKGWAKELMSRGLYFLSSGDKCRIYTDGAGNFGTKAAMKTNDPENYEPVDEPQKLKHDGSLWWDGTGAETTGAYYQTFYDKLPADWGGLSFPTTCL
jgi:hypothetical protein